MLLALVAVSPVRAEEIVAARYAAPVERYGHYALGRPHEYARLVASTDAGRELALELPRDEVFEDLEPRLVRLADNEPPLLLAIVSARASGSRLALVGLEDGALAVVAESEPIGTTNRWLNPVGVADLDGDGEAEIAAVTTPHIGGVLRIHRRRGARLVEIASLGGFSNHVYGSPELDLSRPARIDGRMQLLVPDAQRRSVRAIVLRDGKLVETGRCRVGESVTRPDALDACAHRLQRGASGGGAPARPRGPRHSGVEVGPSGDVRSGRVGSPERDSRAQGPSRGSSRVLGAAAAMCDGRSMLEALTSE